MPFSEDRAQHAVDFIESLEHYKGEWAGNKFKLMDWQEQMVRELFGRVDENGRRKYRRAYWEIPRKNGKSALAAAISNYMLFADGEQGAECYAAAYDSDQAQLIFRPVKKMYKNNKALRERGELKDYKNLLKYPETDSFLKALSKQPEKAEGFDAHFVIYDELHVVQKRALYEKLSTSFGSRREPLMLMITTAGTDRNSLCGELHDYAVKVRDGVIEDENFFPMIFAADPDDDWDDEETWYKANPALGTPGEDDGFKNIEDMRSKAKEAQVNLSARQSFKRRHLNMWVSSESKFIDPDAWDECGGIVRERDLINKRCFGGIDLSNREDITSEVLVFPFGEQIDVLARFWCPEERIMERSREDQVPYNEWAEEGWIKPTPGNVIDYGYVQAKIEEDAKKFDIQRIGFDEWQAAQLAQNLARSGLNMVPIKQNYGNLNLPTQELGRFIRKQVLNHGRNPVLTWMADNVVTKEDPQERIKPSKRASSEKIDGIVALIMALDGFIRNDDEEDDSVYEERGIISVG